MTFLLAILCVLLACGLTCRLLAEKRGYDPTLFTIAGVLGGPFALAAVLTADTYNVADEEPSPVAQLPAPPAQIPSVTSSDTSPMPAPDLHMPDLNEDDLRELDDVSAPAPAPAPIPASEPAPARVPAPTPAPAPALHVRPWETRVPSGQQPPARPMSLVDLARAERPETVRRKFQTDLPAADSEETSAEQDAVTDADARGLGGLISKFKPGKAKSDTPVQGQPDEPTFPVMPVTAPAELDDPIAPGGVTGGVCPHCGEQSYADWYGWCDRCTNPFPVTVALQEDANTDAQADGQEGDQLAAEPVTADTGKKAPTLFGMPLLPEKKNAAEKSKGKTPGKSSAGKAAAKEPFTLFGMPLLPEKKSKKRP